MIMCKVLRVTVGSSREGKVTPETLVRRVDMEISVLNRDQTSNTKTFAQ